MSIMALHTSATGLRALSTELDVISNNLANVNTDGFKASRANFADLFYQYKQQPGVTNAQSDVRPIGVALGLGTTVTGTQLDMTGGSAKSSTRQTDMFIEGDGFFQVKSLSTQGDGVSYTRTGKFTTDANGNLVMADSQGYKLDPPITLPANYTSVDITTDGRVFATVSGSTTPTELQQIQLARFANPQGLKQMGGNLYQKTDASGSPTVGNPGSDGLGTIKQGYVEASNVDPVTELVSLIKTQRNFEFNSKAITAADDMLQVVGTLKR